MGETTAHFRFDGDLVSMKIEKKIILEPESATQQGCTKMKRCTSKIVKYSSNKGRFSFASHNKAKQK